MDTINGNNDLLLDEDEDDNPTIGHIADDPKTAHLKKINTSLKHLGVFFQKYWQITEFQSLNLNSDMDPRDLPYHVIDSECFIGRVVNYLATEAKQLKGGANAKILKHSTVAGYASTICTYYINHFRDHQFGVPKPLRNEVWPKKMSLITQKKQDYHNKMGTKMKDEKETATDDDRRNLAKVCILEGTPLGAEMFHISNTAVTLAGRGSDVADADLRNIQSYEKTEDLISYHILVQDTTRFKTSTHDDHQIFPHRDEFYFCYYFSLAYLLLLVPINVMSTKLFPTFSEKVFDSNKRVDSRVATFFNKCADEFWQLMYEYANGQSILCIPEYPSYSPVTNILYFRCYFCG
jgi:hypothetical protein